ncbi:MAG: DUF2089 domain-containing protein [Candidatus Zixiibacteriota bacterium]|nr:MAG: DUF2089 domain-containing protein [candidate division Zixibacteria bacterium]
MKKDWAYLTRLTGGKPITVERVTIDEEDVAIDGKFDLPPLARLKAEDQVFVAVFVKSHGSIKQMEKQFGISYPTVKGRLNRIADQLDFVEVEATTAADDVLERLDRGEISVDEAIEAIKKGERHE